jgi:predicted PurR-regulated permease PerM
MRAGRDMVFWLAVLGAFILLLWLLSPVLLPFVLGMALGYFLDPVVGWLEHRGLSRSTAAGALILGSVGVGALATILLTPLLVDQAADLARDVPGALATVFQRLLPYVARVMAGMRRTPAGDLTAPLTDAAQHAIGGATGLVTNLVTQGLAVINVLTLLAVTPLAAFYLLRDWPLIVAEIDGWLPRAHAETIRAQCREIDRVLAGFARGSFVVCLVLAVFYAVALTIVGLDFGLVIGLTAGALSFVPYLGFLIGLVSSVGVALYQFWPQWGWILAVLGIFLFGQVMTDYVLTPRLVGGEVGLHPLWVIFAVFAGAALFGFVGMLIAVPACAVIGVFARFAIARYKASAIYRGAEPP